MPHHYFESSSGLTEEFAAFSKALKSLIKNLLPQDANLVSFSRGHFYCSGFIEKHGKFVYFSTSDVRPTWNQSFLIRTASDGKDYRGGANNYTDVEHFTSRVDLLLSKEHQRV